LKGAAAVAAAGVVGGAGARRAEAIDPIGRTRPSHLKLSVAAYSYRDFLGGKRQPKMDMFDFVDRAADMGLDAVEPTSYWFPPDVTAEWLHKLRRHAFLLGLDISGTAIRNDFCVAPGPKREKELADVRGWIDRAADLNAPVIRVFGGTVPKGDSEDAAAERVIEGLKAVLPYAVEKGVVLALENHGGITATPAQLLRLVRGVDSPNFGVNLDTGNFRSGDPYADLAQLAPYAVNVQVKTDVVRNGQTKEDADLARVVQVLRDAKYSGYVVLEYEGAEDPLTAIPKHIKTLRSLIGPRG
jgi:sugar phosphate isomerase/epimerase